MVALHTYNTILFSMVASSEVADTDFPHMKNSHVGSLKVVNKVQTKLGNLQL